MYSWFYIKKTQRIPQAKIGLVYYNNLKLTQAQRACLEKFHTCASACCLT
jgi:hypothetical protein